MRNPFCKLHTQKASVLPEHTGAPANQLPGEKSLCTEYTGMTGPESPCIGARAGWPGGKYHVHRLHICVLFPALPVKMSAESGWGAADCAVHLHAADSHCVAGCAGYAAAAAMMKDLAAQQYHREHSPVCFHCLEEWCGQLEV